MKLGGRVAAHVAVGLDQQRVLCSFGFDSDMSAFKYADPRIGDVPASAYARQFAQDGSA